MGEPKEVEQANRNSPQRGRSLRVSEGRAPVWLEVSQGAQGGRGLAQGSRAAARDRKSVMAGFGAQRTACE